MDYEKLYNELKEKHDTLVTTFETFQETSKKEKEDLQKEYDTFKETSGKEITDLKNANVSLYLQIPKEPTKEQTAQTPQETKVTCDDIIKKLGGTN